MYQIKCDGNILYDPRDEELVVLNPKCHLKENTVCESSFTILQSHPYYHTLKKGLSIVEILQDGQPIFRGRMTDDSGDFYNQMFVDLEGVLAFANDTMIPPFKFPEDFPDAASADNVVEHLFSWVIDQHNAYAEPWQQFKVGRVTVSDPNNVITRSSDKYVSTWKTFEEKFFNSALGGYLVIRYEDDGNYLDYLSDFELTNMQTITFGENLLDITKESSTTDTYSAILPLGADGLTLASLPDGDLTEDLVKDGLYIYSKSAKTQYGWKVIPVEDSTWDDVTTVANLRTKAIDKLVTDGMLLSNTIKAKAVDLHFTDEEIQSFRIYRWVIVNSPVHNLNNVRYKLTELDIDILHPENTDITVGSTVRTLTDINRQEQQNNTQKIEEVTNNLKNEVTGEVTDALYDVIIEQSTSAVNTAEEIIFEALKSYTTTSDLEKITKELASKLELLAGEMTLQFSKTNSAITDVNGDLQKKYNTITTYFTFEVDGLTIGKVDNPYKMVLDNDRLSMYANGVELLWMDVTTKEVHTPKLTITDQFNSFGYIEEEDEAGNVNCIFVG